MLHIQSVRKYTQSEQHLSFFIFKFFYLFRVSPALKIMSATKTSVALLSNPAWRKRKWDEKSLVQNGSCYELNKKEKQLLLLCTSRAAADLDDDCSYDLDERNKLKRKIKCLHAAATFVNLLLSAGHIYIVAHIMQFLDWETALSLCYASEKTFDSIKGNAKILRQICWNNTTFSAHLWFSDKEKEKSISKCRLDIDRLLSMKSARDLFREYLRFNIGDNVHKIDSVVLPGSGSQQTRTLPVSPNSPAQITDPLSVSFNPIYNVVAVQQSPRHLEIFRYSGKMRDSIGCIVYSYLGNPEAGEFITSVKWSPNGIHLLVQIIHYSYGKIPLGLQNPVHFYATSFRLFRYHPSTERMTALIGDDKIVASTINCSRHTWIDNSSILVPDVPWLTGFISVLEIGNTTLSFRPLRKEPPVKETSLRSLCRIKADKKEHNRRSNLLTKKTDAEPFAGSIFVVPFHERSIFFVANCWLHHDHVRLVEAETQTLRKIRFYNIPGLIRSIDVRDNKIFLLIAEPRVHMWNTSGDVVVTCGEDQYNSCPFEHTRYLPSRPDCAIAEDARGRNHRDDPFAMNGDRKLRRWRLAMVELLQPTPTPSTKKAKNAKTDDATSSCYYNVNVTNLLDNDTPAYLISPEYKVFAQTLVQANATYLAQIGYTTDVYLESDDFNVYIMDWKKATTMTIGYKHKYVRKDIDKQLEEQRLTYHHPTKPIYLMRCRRRPRQANLYLHQSATDVDKAKYPYTTDDEPHFTKPTYMSILYNLPSDNAEDDGRDESDDYEST